MNVRIFWVRAMKCMCAQTRPRFIHSSERVFGGVEFEPMLTPREKSPLPENVPRGGSNPRRCGQRAQALPTGLFRPPNLNKFNTLPFFSFPRFPTDLLLTFASKMNLEMTTGCSLDTAEACVRKFSRSTTVCATFMAAPLRTYDGRTRHGKPTSWQNEIADWKNVFEMISLELCSKPV